MARTKRTGPPSPPCISYHFRRLKRVRRLAFDEHTRFIQGKTGMSGLNPVTRTLLRFANWIAGEPQANWSAAMAGETDAAGSQGLSWALGCVGAALRMRLATDWKRIAILIVVPVVAYTSQWLWIYPVTWAMRADWIGQMGWAMALQLPYMIMMALVARFSSNDIPMLFVAYAVAVIVLLPGIVFAVTFGKSPFLFLQPEANWLNLPRNQGMALLGALLAGSVVAGRVLRRASLRTA